MYIYKKKVYHKWLTCSTLEFRVREFLTADPCDLNGFCVKPIIDQFTVMFERKVVE